MKEILSTANNVIPYTWIDISQPTVEELDLIAREFNLHEYTVRDCLEPDHLPKYELIGTTKFLITRVYAPKSVANPHTIQEITTKIAVFYNDSFIITIHRKTLPFIHFIKEQCDDSEVCKKTDGIVTQILWNALHTYEAPADDLSKKIDYYEEEIFLKNHIPNIQRSIYFLKRKAVTCKKVILLTSDVIHKVHAGFPSNPSLQDLLDLHLKLTTQYDQIIDDSNNILNIYIALASQKTNEVMKILTIFSAFFLPLTFIAGVYGMNFDNMPELHTKWGYGAVMILMVITTIGIYIWFRRKRLIKK